MTLLGYNLESYYIQMMGYLQQEGADHVIFWEARLIGKVQVILHFK